MNKENLGEKFQKINPMKVDNPIPKLPFQQIPALDVDGKILIQSMPICEFLEEHFPEPALLPKDPYERANVRAVCEVVNSGIQPLFNANVIGKVKEIGYPPQKWGSEWIESGFRSKSCTKDQ